MDTKDLLNWTTLSIIISGNSESIRRNRIPAKYEEQVNIFITALQAAITELRDYDINNRTFD